MKNYLKPFAHLLLAGSLALAATAPAQAQGRTAKQAEKINEKRNDYRAETSRLSADQLDYNSDFVVAAASRHQLGLALSQLAQQKALATEVRDWGQHLEATREQAQRELRQLAYQEHITVPGAMSKDARETYDDVDDRRYFGFDKKYLRTLKDLSEGELKLYAEAATRLTNPALQRYVARHLPELRRNQLTIARLYERTDERK